MGYTLSRREFMAATVGAVTTMTLCPGQALIACKGTKPNLIF